MAVIDEIAAERRRQIEQEGWDAQHDSQHICGELSIAAACYAIHAADWKPPVTKEDLLNRMWPWSREWWKPKDARRDLIRAGALIVAEIERLDRIAAAKAA